MDWACDEVLCDFYNLICELGVCGTLNVTHNTKLLNNYRQNDRLELGIHPNYNKLLDGMGEKDSYETILERMKLLVPEAITVRNHSLTTNSRIQLKEVDYGIKYDLNMLYPPQSGDCIRAFKDVNGLYKLPFIFEDDVWLMSHEKRNVQYYLSDEFMAPRIFNFHPIHIFLNTEYMARYEKVREVFHDFEQLKGFRNREQYGIRDFLTELINEGRIRGYTFLKIKDGDWQ